MLVATGVLALLLLVAVAVAAVTRLSLARAFLIAGSALALPLTAITGNVVGGTGCAPVMARSAANQWSGSLARSRSSDGTTSAPIAMIS